MLITQKSQLVLKFLLFNDALLGFNFLLAATVVFLVLLTGMMAFYYKRIRFVQEKYEVAREVIEDIVISFNNQLRLLEEHVRKVGHKLEFLSVRSGDVTDVTEQLKKLEKQLGDITFKVDRTLAFKGQIEKMRERIDKLTETQKSIMEQMVKPQEVQIEGVIPIRREHALAQLTPTELRVLEILSEEGQKTAPEIKNKIGLTREHTARLMKKLYEKGYIERSETKTPYIYRIQEEMRRILEKSKSVPP
jgi:CTP-dependent riboflavin kinase